MVSDLQLLCACVCIVVSCIERVTFTEFLCVSLFYVLVLSLSVLVIPHLRQTKLPAPCQLFYAR